MELFLNFIIQFGFIIGITSFAIQIFVVFNRYYLINKNNKIINNNEHKFNIILTFIMFFLINLYSNSIFLLPSILMAYCVNLTLNNYYEKINKHNEIISKNIHILNIFISLLFLFSLIIFQIFNLI